MEQYSIDVISALAERTIKRLWIVIILLIVLLFGSNAAWIWYESQWEVVETSETYTAETDGGGMAVANRGDFYGESDLYPED